MRQLTAQTTSRGTRRGSARRRSGFTLVEIMIALAIFVIGALAIMRIFPPSFRVVQGSEMRAIGTRMDKSTLARLTNEPGLMPDATYDAVYNTSTSAWDWNSPLTTTTPTVAIAPVGTSSRNANLPNDITPSAFAQSSLVHFKHIVGERHKLFTVSSLNGVAPPAPQLYLLTQFPYVVPPTAPPTAPGFTVYREGDVTGVTIHDKSDASYPDGELDFRNATLASDPSVAFNDPTTLNRQSPPRDMRSDVGVTYYVSYRWVENGNIQGVIDEPIQATQQPVGTTVPMQTMQGQHLTASANDHVIAGSVSVRFRLPVAASPGSSTLGYVQVTGTGQTAELTNALAASDTVSIDYEVPSWQMLVQDDSPDKYPNFGASATPTPVPAARQMTVPARPVADDATTPVFVSLSGTNTNANANPGATTVFTATWTAGTITGPSAALLDFDRKFGRATFDSNLLTTNNVGGARARVVYQGLDNWTHQLIVGARSYIPWYPTVQSNPRERWREYYWQGSDVLYFQPSEAGKSMLVTYRYQPAGGGSVVETSSIVTIDDLTNGLVNASFGPTSFPATLQHPAGATVVSILAVQGVGVRARTAWVDNDHYQQATVAGYRSADQL